MIKYNQLFCVIVLFTIFSINSVAQNYPSPSTNSPYTRYGYGQLSDQAFGRGKAMGGIGYGVRTKGQINPLNPASYTAIDSLTFLFEGGFSLENTNFSDGNIKKNAQNANFDYIAMHFRISRNFAASAGFLPFSNVGYNISSERSVPGNDNITATNTFDGNGGLSQLYVGLGFKIVEGLSVGTNISYLFGTIEHSSLLSYSDATVNSSRKYNHVRVNDYKLDLGIQYTQQFAKVHALTLGAIYSLKHNIHNEAYTYTQMIEGYTLVSQEENEIKDGFSIPHTFGGGLTYVYKNRLTVGADYTFQKWGETKVWGETDQLKDQSKVALGAEYIPNPYSRNYFNRVQYRAGFHYSDSYIKVKGENGAKEFGASIGLGLPIYRSMVNIGAQYVKIKPKTSNLIEENTFRINIGLTFNERWFAKWKVQ